MMTWSIWITTGLLKSLMTFNNTFFNFSHQLDLLSQMCQEQQYLAIDPPLERGLMNISQQLPAELGLQ